MKNENTSWFSKITKFVLVLSLSLVIFGVLSSVISFIFSFFVSQFGFKDRILNADFGTNFAIVMIAIFIVMSFSLFSSQKWLYSRLEEIEESVGSGLLSFLAFILGSLLLVIFYFGFSYYLTFLNNLFWI